MLRVLYLLFFFGFISCNSIKKQPIIDYYPTPQIHGISTQSIKRVVFLYKKKEISQSRFLNLTKGNKKLTFQVIKDSSEIVRMGYDSNKIRGIVSIIKKNK